MAVGTVTPSGTSYGTYSTSTFAVTAGTHTIAFVGQAPATGDSTAFLDAVSIAVAAPVAPAVADSGFESAATGTGFYGFVVSPQGTPWAYSGGAGVSTNGTGLTSGNPNAPQGSQVAFIQNQGSISQAISNTTDGSYTLSLKAAQRANYGTAQSFEVLVDGAVVGTFGNLSTTYQSLTTATFHLSVGSHTIAFVGQAPSSGDSTAFIDAVAIQAATLSGTPNLPVISLTNPGSQVNKTNDVISLPVQGSASGVDTLYYSATGLPTGLTIDANTGVISGMDDDFNAANGAT